MRSTTAAFIATLSILSNASWAGAVSRVGNRSILDDRAAASASVPLGYYASGSEAVGWVRLAAPGLRTQTIDVLDFRASYPERSSLLRARLAAELEADGWQEFSLGGATGCVYAARKQGEHSTSTVVTWGEGRGMVFVASLSAGNARALSEMLASLTVPTEECAWPEDPSNG